MLRLRSAQALLRNLLVCQGRRDASADLGMTIKGQVSGHWSSDLLLWLTWNDNWVGEFLGIGVADGRCGLLGMTIRNFAVIFRIQRGFCCLAAEAAGAMGTAVKRRIPRPSGTE